MLDLVLKSLLVILILLLVFSTYDLLSLFSNSVKLDILCSLNQVLDKQGEPLDLSLDLFKLCLRVEDFFHILDLAVASLFDLSVFEIEVSPVDKDGILVVSCYWKLWNLNLSLL